MENPRLNEFGWMLVMEARVGNVRTQGKRRTRIYLSPTSQFADSTGIQRRDPLSFLKQTRKVEGYGVRERLAEFQCIRVLNCVKLIQTQLKMSS